MENQDYRNYNVCTKVTANQKTLYRDIELIMENSLECH